MTWLNHVTLSTDHIRRSSRAEVTDEAVAQCRDLIDACLTAGGPLPLRPEPLSHHGVQCLTAGGALLVTLSAPAGPHNSGRPHSGPVRPLVSFGVVARSRDAARMWTMLQGLAGAGAQRPPAPWIAAVLHVHDTPPWVGDFERTMGWAWIERGARP